jgi:uncharacterized protein YecE (DUF72 family)
MMRIGTAGWSIPRQDADAFPAEGSSLERYAARFNAAEINSSFHRPHRQSTWLRWRESAPESFRFSVKLPKTITHQQKLHDVRGLLADFADQVSELRDKLAVLLVQLPPKLAFDPELAGAFFADMKQLLSAPVVCEPRHLTWFTPEADRLLADCQVARVAADPALCETAGEPGGWRGLRYWRLHGSPVIYRSSYADRIADYAARLREDAEPGRDSWCIFDNTASSAGAGDALLLQRALEG